MGVDACGRPTELPDNHNVGADGAPGETQDFLSLLKSVPGGIWDEAKGAAHGVAAAASGAWDLAADNDGARARFGQAVGHQGSGHASRRQPR